jgi:LmbE family N-acetylglucosaminyl deacetylase
MNTTRRDFLLCSTALLGTLPLSALAATPAAPGAPRLHAVCVGAHPDDPESGCGGTLLRFRAAGHRVTVVYLTRGEAGIVGRSHEEAARIRTGEATAACARLGAEPVFFGQIDGAAVYDRDAIAAMTRRLDELAPDLVFGHWPLDAHPDHQVASLLCQQAWLRARKPFSLFFYEVCAGSQTTGFHPTDHVDISDVRAAKRALVDCHASQDPADIYAGGGHALMEEFRGVEIQVRAAEAFVRMTGRHERPLI